MVHVQTPGVNFTRVQLNAEDDGTPALFSTSGVENQTMTDRKRYDASAFSDTSCATLSAFTLNLRSGFYFWVFLR